MVRNVSLVRSKKQAFKIGLMAETFGNEESQASKYDAFILSEPGVPAVKIEEKDILDNIMIIFHRYSSIPGEIISVQRLYNHN